jgi:hypothetical protein
MRVGVLDNEKQLRDDAQDLRFLLICRVSVAAGPGFEPGLTDPESGSVRLQLFPVVNTTAYLRRFLERSVAHCSPMFLPGWCTNWRSSTITDAKFLRTHLLLILAHRLYSDRYLLARR